MTESIPFILVTGFLGSGKTTFLKKLVNTLPTANKIAVIQNEFAPSNIDGEELMQSTGESFKLLEINNGSVFCVCLLESFLNSLSEFVDVHQPDLIIMEASGLSDPAGIAELFQSEEIKDKVYFNEAWCIVDAAHFEKIERMNVRYRHQVQVADHVIVNKIDRVESATTEKVKERVRALNPFCKISTVTYCDVEFSLLDRKGNLFRPSLLSRIDAVKSEGRPAIQSGVVKLNVRPEKDKLVKYFEEQNGQFIRVKGFFTSNEGVGFALHVVHGDVMLEELETYDGNLHLIFMGEEIETGMIGLEIENL